MPSRQAYGSILLRSSLLVFRQARIFCNQTLSLASLQETDISLLEAMAASLCSIKSIRLFGLSFKGVRKLELPTTNNPKRVRIPTRLFRILESKMRLKCFSLFITTQFFRCFRFRKEVFYGLFPGSMPFVIVWCSLNW